MEDDDASRAAAGAIQASISPLQIAIKDMELLSQRMPAAEDFHYYSNFSQFRSSVATIQTRAESLLSRIGTCKQLRSEASPWPMDVEESYDWLVGVQDDVLEGVGSALDQLGLGAGKRPPDFLLSKGKKKTGLCPRAISETTPGSGVKVASRKRDKPPVPFHVKSLPRPQDKFDYPVDNSNSPFKHLSREVLLGRSGEVSLKSDRSALELHAKELGLLDTKAAHPLKEELTNMAFLKDFPAADGSEPLKPKSLSETPLFIVETLSALETMAAKLRASREIAVDLENHHYRSFQGFVCLMQVSTRSQDFIIDTLALRSYIGPVLRDVFANPSIRKVIHGSDRDILWLQRDFGIYVCNLFDTGQAARVLRMESYGLAFLLQNFCGVEPDKRYQLADWRLRPLNAEMLKYAREDTHYLLYVYDRMKEMLLEGQATDDLYVEVCKRSRDLCLQLYEKELFTESSFTHIYGLADKNFSPERLAIVAGLYAWRDKICRSEDESTGYILPNSLIFRLAEEAPENAKKLQGILKRGHPVAGFHSAALLKVIRDAAETAVAQQPVSVSISSNPEDVEEGEIDDTEKPEDLSPPKPEVMVSTKAGPGFLRGDSYPVFEEPDFETVETPPVTVHAATPTTMQIKRSSVAEALFGPSAQVDSDEEENEESMAKALAIQASMSLSFHRVKAAAAEEQQVETELKTDLRAAEVVEKLEGTPEEVEECPEVEETIPLEGEDEEMDVTSHTEDKHADDIQARDSGPDVIPLSLNERYGSKQQPSRRRERVKKPRKRPSDAAAISSKDGVETSPFSVKRDKKDHFDPAANGELKTVDGIQQVGKRRFVFPKSGNRTAVFK